MSDNLIDFKELVKYFFIKVNRPNDIEVFLNEVDNSDLTKLLLDYNNMALWNEIFCSFQYNKGISLKGNKIIKKIHSLEGKNHFYWKIERFCLILYLYYR